MSLTIFNKNKDDIIQHAVKIGIYLENSNYSTITENYIKYKIASIHELNCDGNCINDNICIKISEPPYAYLLFLVLGEVIVITLFITRKKLKRNN